MDIMDIKKRDKYLFAGALIVLGVFALFGVIKGAGAERRSTLILAQLLGDRLDGDLTTSLIREFEDRNPGIRIRPAGRAQEGADFSADIIIFDEGHINMLLRQNRLASLGPYVFSDNELDQWAVPLVSFMDLLFYHIDLLKEAGFDRPPKTRAEFLACARAAAAQDRTNGVALALSPADPRSIRRELFSWIWASGATLTREGKVNFSSPPVVEALDFLGRMSREGLLSPGSFEKTGAEKAEEFAEGKTALMIGSAEDIPFLRKRMGDRAFGITLIPPPAEYSGKPVFGPSQWYAGISASCGHPDGAWAFLTFLAEKRPLLAAQVRAVPGSGGSPGPYVREDDLYSKAWDIYEAAELIQELLPRGDELETIIREELKPLFAGEKTAAETAAAIQDRWDKGR
jgi:multiple sugar transport system substrate-binding protein